MPWSYDPRTARYRDSRTGRFLAHETIVQIRDTFAERVRVEMGKVTDAYQSGRLSAGEWKTAMRGQLKNSTIASYELGKGGGEQMTAADYGRVGRALRDQYAYLEKFAAQVPQMTPEGVSVRAQLYAETAIGAYETGRAQALIQAGVKEATWHTAADEAVCPICEPLDGVTIDLKTDELPPLHPRCRCWTEPA